MRGGGGRGWGGSRRVGRGCQCRPWVTDRGGASRAKRAGCLGNPRRPGHSSHATGRILKAPVPDPVHPPGPPGSPTTTPRSPRCGHPAPSSPTTPAGARSPGMPAEPRGERERGKIAPVCAVPGGRGDSPLHGVPPTRGDERGPPPRRPRGVLASRLPRGGSPVPPPVLPGKAEGGEPGGRGASPGPPRAAGAALLAHSPDRVLVGKGAAGQHRGSRYSLPRPG